MAHLTSPITCQILVAEEEDMLRRGLSALVSTQSGFKVVDSTSDHSPADLIIAQAEMLKTTDLRADLPVLCITSKHSSFLPERADGEYRRFVERSSSPEEFLSLLRGLASAIGDRGERVSRSSPTALPSALADLTAREREVLGFLAERLTIRQIAAELGLSMKTIESHTLNIMRKLDIHQRPKLISFARAHGLSAATSAL